MEIKDRRVTEIGQRLYHRVHHRREVASVWYCVTITPIGKNITHEELYNSFIDKIYEYKQVRETFFIYEVENTNHMHGIIKTKQEYAFTKLFKKGGAFNFHIKNIGLNKWCEYISKTKPKHVHVGNRYQDYLNLHVENILHY